MKLYHCNTKIAMPTIAFSQFMLSDCRQCCGKDHYDFHKRCRVLSTCWNLVPGCGRERGEDNNGRYINSTQKKELQTERFRRIEPKQAPEVSPYWRGPRGGFVVTRDTPETALCVVFLGLYENDSGTKSEDQGQHLPAHPLLATVPMAKGCPQSQLRCRRQAGWAPVLL